MTDSLIQKIQQLCRHVVGPAAEDVDRNARFPHESFAALKEERLLSALVPSKLGGLGCSIAEMVATCDILARHCGSTALIWAMHQIQVACLVRHCGRSTFFQNYLRLIASHQLLLASVTSEPSVEGNVRKSVAAIQPHRSEFSLTKEATSISYGEYADGFLVTARREKNAPGNDQVLALLNRANTVVRKTSEWDALGMRGTCSSGFRLSSQLSQEHILPVPFSDIAAQTMTPVSHILWSACWLGIATDAVARARNIVQARASEKEAATRSGDVRLAEAIKLLQQMRASINECTDDFVDLTSTRGSVNASPNMKFVIKNNNLKVTSSELVVAIVGRALAICGMAGYVYTSPYSVGRHLRDAYSAAVMVGNSRINAANAALLLVQTDL